MSKISLIIPAKEESESLPHVLAELKNFDYEIYIVLEKSDTKTIDSIKNFKVNIIYQTNKGYGDALILGIKNVKTEYFVIFNADGSFNPSEVKNMHDNAIKKNANFIFGSRYMKGSASDDDTIITFIGNKIFTFIGKIFFSLPISDILYTYILGNTQKANELRLKEKSFSFCAEFPILAKKSKHKLISVPSHERERIAGKKKVSEFKDGFLILISMIKMYFKH